ncbi:MAG TPA: TlyA family RNA methyltransferase [Candidatus Acidoferrales bacterium]|jgi:23S rRNA (cytidine1920-2'-O)/16S rRNA (cytidine1409-2'-O)-methyltransferase|nr:TlyA family RNA methyltransferase [Candidatus Acidoferrales bacterium]
MNAPRSTSKRQRIRVDAALVARQLAETPQRARALVMAGKVLVDNQRVTKSGEMVATDARIEITDADFKYASRAGLKLEGALEDLGVDARNLVCLDVGASNGGFTDCLLQRGALRVYAVDVNTAQLDWKLQRDARVIAIRNNARFLRPADIAEKAELVTMDVSFISVTKLIGVTVAMAKRSAVFLILVKPQFELPKAMVGKGGIVRDAALHERAIASVRTAAEKAGLEVLGVRPSRVTGKEGNQEYFLHARLPE